MGLSRDVTMGEDLTTNCVVRGNGAVDIVTGEVASSRVTRDTVNSVTTSYDVTCNTVFFGCWALCHSFHSTFVHFPLELQAMVRKDLSITERSSTRG